MFHFGNFCGDGNIPPSRDAGVIVIGHFVWTILSILLVFSLLGVADHSGKINIKNLTSPSAALAALGDTDGDSVAAAAAATTTAIAEGLIAKDFWLIGITLAETALGGLEYNWLWSGLLFCLVSFLAHQTYASEKLVSSIPSLTRLCYAQ